MKTLDQQFGKLKPPKPYSAALRQCYEINNYTALRIFNYITTNKCKLEKRSNLESENWVDGTLNELVRSLTSGKENEINQFDNWTLKFWRIKPKPTYEELEKILKQNKIDY